MTKKPVKRKKLSELHASRWPDVLDLSGVRLDFLQEEEECDASGDQEGSLRNGQVARWLKELRDFRDEVERRDKAQSQKETATEASMKADAEVVSKAVKREIAAALKAGRSWTKPRLFLNWTESIGAMRCSSTHGTSPKRRPSVGVSYCVRLKGRVALCADCMKKERP